MPFLNSNIVSSCHLTNERQSAAIRLGNAGPDNISVFMYHKNIYVQVLCGKILNERHYIINRCYLIVEVCLSKPIICQGSNNNT